MSTIDHQGDHSMDWDGSPIHWLETHHDALNFAHASQRSNYSDLDMDIGHEKDEQHSRPGLQSAWDAGLQSLPVCSQQSNWSEVSHPGTIVSDSTESPMNVSQSDVHHQSDPLDADLPLEYVIGAIRNHGSYHSRELA